MREAAQASVSIEAASSKLGIEVDRLRVLLGRLAYRDAWLSGRRELRRELDAALIDKAKTGSVPALRLALDKLEREQLADVVRAAQAEDAELAGEEPDEDAPAPLSFRDRFREESRRESAS